MCLHSYLLIKLFNKQTTIYPSIKYKYNLNLIVLIAYLLPIVL